MEGFRFDVQTCLYFGRYAVKEHQEVFDDFGKKAVIVTSKFAEGCENTGLRDVSEIFEEKGIEYKIIDYTMTNPPVENIKEMYEDTKVSCRFYRGNRRGFGAGCGESPGSADRRKAEKS